MPVFVTDYYTEARYYLERLSELYGVMHGVRSVGLRLFSVYGENEIPKGKYANIISQFIWCLLKGERPVIYGDGTQTRDFIYVEDVVDAFLISMDLDKGGIFNVGTGIETSFNEAFSMIKEVLGSDLEPEYVANPIKNYVYRTKADTKKAEQDLGFKARVSLKEGIERLVKHYRNYREIASLP
jgi:UDP-glucose 4-epimerase